jgi:hypothetical protein
MPPRAVQPDCLSLSPIPPSIHPSEAPGGPPNNQETCMSRLSFPVAATGGATKWQDENVAVAADSYRFSFVDGAFLF